MEKGNENLLLSINTDFLIFLHFFVQNIRLMLMQKNKMINIFTSLILA
jgi:hypothetical protein